MHHNTPRSVHNRIQRNMAWAQKRAWEEAQYERQQKRSQEECDSDVGVNTGTFIFYPSFSWSHTFKASSSHCKAGSSTSRANLADAASHSHSHLLLSSQYSSTAFAVLSSPAPNVSCKFSIIDILKWLLLLRDTPAAKNLLSTLHQHSLYFSHSLI